MRHIPKPGIGIVRDSSGMSRPERIAADTFELSENRHLHGLCYACDAPLLARLTLEKAEDWYYQGMMGQVEYEAYRWVWATDPAHEGYSCARGWTDLPWDPDVVMVGGLIRAALAQDNLKNRRG